VSKIIQPGSTIGVLGSGQLGRMFTIAARRLGYRVNVFSPDDDTPTGQVADTEIQKPYDDLDAVAEFAKGVDVVTFEFENVPTATINRIDKFVPVHPAGEVLHTTQERLREKYFLREMGIPVTPFQPIQSFDELRKFAKDNLPAVLKTASWGYDGKGQTKIENMSEVESAWIALDTNHAILEKFIDFKSELSVVAARSQDGEIIHYNPIVNTHQNHILDLSVTFDDLLPRVVKDALQITRTILEKLDVVGVLCVEFFLTHDEKLLVNELAPRPHNSGHLTIDAYATCQFEQQVRAVCGLPFGEMTQFQHAAMVNLLGDIWDGGQPNWQNALTFNNAKLHLYGKKEPRLGRKMGHLTILSDNPYSAVELALSARKSLFHKELSHK
jgi:5-(carboxyamino)imidazole ribonucleotide synthase